MASTTASEIMVDKKSKKVNEKIQNEVVLGKFLGSFEVPLMLAIKNNDYERKYDYKPREGDILVTGPMKSGTTWIQQIYHQLRTRGDMDFENLFDVSWWMPYFFQKGPSYIDFNADQVASPRVFKSHEPFHFAPKHPGLKHVICFRHPSDIAYSGMKFFASFMGFEGDTKVSHKLMELMLRGKGQEVVGAARFYGSWWPHKDDPDVLFVFYEDLKKDLARCIPRLAAFGGIDTDEALIQIATTNSSFETMLKNKSKFSPNRSFGEVMQIEDFSPKIGMIRSDGGMIGQGKKESDEALQKFQLKLWQTHVESVTGYANYDQLYAEHSWFKNES